MDMIELFSGVGSPKMALRNIGFADKVHTVAISDIDEDAILMYNRIHGSVKNLGDVRKIKELPLCDFLWASSPCTTFTNCGHRTGLDGESGLILEVKRLLENYKARGALPKLFGFENVVNLLEKFENVWTAWLDFLEVIGYNIYYSVLNSLYFDCPQKRERIYLIGIRKDVDDGAFKMPKNEIPTEKRLGDILEPSERIPEKFFFTEEQSLNRSYRIRPIPKNTLQTIQAGYYHTKKSKCRTQSNRIYSREGVCPTITTSAFINLEEGKLLRRMIPIEYWRAMGFSDEDFEKIKDFSYSSLIEKAGNSICVRPLESIFSELFKGGRYL